MQEATFQTETKPDWAFIRCLKLLGFVKAPDSRSWGPSMDFTHVHVWWNMYEWTSLSFIFCPVIHFTCSGFTFLYFPESFQKAFLFFL